MLCEFHCLEVFTLKIALLTETWHPFTNGVVTHIEVLSEGLTSLGHQVLVMTSDPLIQQNTLDEQGVYRCPGKPLKKVYGYALASPFGLERYRYLKGFQPEVIHIHQEFGMGTFGLIASRLLRVPLVYTLHTAYDDYLHYLATPPLIPLVRFLSRGYVKCLASSASLVTGPSEKSAAYIKARGVKTPFVYIPNSINRQKFNPEVISPGHRQLFRENLGIDQEATLAIFVGRLGREKSVEVLLQYWHETVESIENLHLLIVGEGPEANALKVLVKTAGLDHQVHFMGKVPHTHMPLYYGASDLFVTASTTEMMSIAMLEAQSMGLPVLQRFDPLNAGQISEGVNGFVYTDAAGFGNHLLSYHRLTFSEKEEWRHRCRQYVAHQDASDLANRLLDVYSQAQVSQENPREVL